MNTATVDPSLAIRRGSIPKSRRCPAYLNIGCGNHFHPEWTNIDLIANERTIIKHDVTEGLPFDDSSFDAIYHSHVLEHLKPDQGMRLIEECFRALKPGGIMRLIVPDLERIAELYLELHIRAWEGDRQAQTDYLWMKLELLDQMVRECSGGRMGQYMANPEIQNSDFVQSRVGSEFQICRKSVESSKTRPTGLRRVANATRKMRERVAKRFVRYLLGPQAEVALDEGLFRSQGEVHRWMYDRYSLREICEGMGFKEFKVLTASQSNIPDFDRFQLDMIDGVIRKPDSLFCECLKSDE